jgi:hypothetical protein
MKLLGLLLLVSGWGLVLAALEMLTAPSMLTGFVLAGAGVEVLGLSLTIRSHLPNREDTR